MMNINRFTKPLLILLMVAAFSLTAAAQWFPDLELEGNTIDDSVGAPDDWENIWDGTEEGSGFLASVFIPQSIEGVEVDTTYLTTGASKDNSDLSNWVLTTNNVAADKTQLQNAFAAGYVCPPGGRESQTDGITEPECDADDLIVYVGADRYDTNGTSQMGFWLLRDELIADFTDNRFERSDGSPAGHKDGDQLVQVDFVNGGAEFIIRVYRWDGDGETGAGLQLIDTIVNPICGVAGVSPDVCGSVNPAQIDSPWPYTDKDGDSDGGLGTSVVPIHGFFEARINLTRVFDTQTSNLGCFSSFMAESRSSAPPTARLQDFALGKFGLCDIEVTKVAAEDNVCNDTGVASISYTYTVTNKGGLPLDVTLIDDNGTPGNTADDFDVIFEDGATADGTNSIGEYITIGAGDMETFTVIVDGVSGTVTNTVLATGAAGQDSSVSHSAMETVNVNQCKISVTKTADESAICEAQGSASYDFSVTNDGTVTLYDITLIDDRGTGAPADDVEILTLASLAPGATEYANDQVLDIAESFIPGDSVVNQVTAKGNSVDGGDISTEVTATASASVDIKSCSISITKTPDRAQVCNGDASITYDYVVTNTGTAAVENLIAIDDNGTVDPADDVMLTLNSLADGTGDVIDSLAANGDMAYASLVRNLGDAATSVTNIVVANGTSLNGWVIDEADADATVVVETCKLTLKKRVINDDGGSTQATAWTLNAGALINEAGSDIGNNEALTTTALALTGVGYDLSESGGPASGYTEGDFTCDGGTLTGQSIEIGFGDDVTCTVENDDIAPRLKLVKTVDNGNGGTLGPGDWDLTAAADSGDASRDFTFAGDNGQYHDVFAGVTYNLSESVVSGYTAGNWSCVGGGTQVGNSITLGPDEMATCTINNDDIPPQLTLQKIVVNDNGGTATKSEWTLEALGGPTPISGTDGVTGDGTFKAGTYNLSEKDGPLYYSQVGNWSCTGNSDDGSDNAITIGINENVTCTVTNTDDAPRLTLVKTVNNGNGGTAATTDWNLSATGTGSEDPGSISGAGGVVSGSTFDAGTYDLAESAGPGGYTAGSWSCDGGQNASDPQVTVALGDDITCTINNDDIPPQLTLQKIVVNDNGGTATKSEWTLEALGGPTPISGTDGVTGDDTFKAGTYTLSEKDGPMYYSQVGNWSCTGNSDDGSDNAITIGINENVTCTVTNTDDAPRLTLVKVVNNGANPGGTAVTTDWTLSATGTGSEDPGSISGDGGTVSGSDFDAGTYDLAESAGPDGYIAGSWSCDGGQNASDPQVTVALGDDITCTITNTAMGRIDITKTSSGALSAGWTFAVLSGASVSSQGTQEASCTTDEFGFCDFGGTMFPAGDYAFCETNMLPGWLSELSSDALYPGNFVPNSDDPNHDNSVICVPFTLNVGETVSFVVDNTPPPGGDARTIGFWKNWTSCDGHGNQDDVLGLNLPVEQLGPMSISTCPVAVDLLDKRDIADPEEVKDGKKRAGDAAYGLAAQLLAYELNLNAGAGTCTAASEAAFKAHILLVTIDFDGTGNELKGKNAKTYSALASEYAGILDSFNNNTLCEAP